MQLLFNLTVPRGFACPTVLLVIHFINRGHVYSTMKSLCYKCCTHSQEGNEFQRLQKCEMSTCFFPKLSLCRYQSFNPYLFVRCLGIWLPSTFCKMLDASTPPGKHRRKTICVLFRVLSPQFGHLWKDMIFINNQNFTHFMSQRPNSASKDHILTQVMLRHHGKMTVFVLKHSASSSAARAVKYKQRSFWVSIKSRSEFI